MKLHLNITGKLALILVLFGTAMLGGLGALAYNSGQAGLQEAATSELLTRATEKHAALDGWIGAARITIVAKAEDPDVAEQAAILLAAASGSPEGKAAHDQLVADVQPLIGSGASFTELFFIDADTGQVLVATDPGEEGKFKENLSFFINGKRAPYVSEMYYSVSLGHPAMTAAAPVMAADGRLLGVLAGQLDLDVLNTFISRRTSLRQTDDAFLVNAIGLLITQPRFISVPRILYPTLKTETIERCLEGSSGVISAADYRGVPVLVSYQWFPERQMCLIVKVDQAEAFAPSLAFSRTVAWASGLALVLGVVLAMGLARTFTHPILALQTGAARLSQGDLAHRVAVKSQDEIGRLAAAFNEMAASLEKQVAERRQAEARFRDLLESAPDAMVIVDEGGTIELVNAEAVRIFGYLREEMIGHAVEMLLTGRFAARHVGHRADFFAKPRTRQMGADLNLFARRKDGSDFAVEVSLSPLQTPAGLLISAVVRDITERKQIEAEILALNASLEQRVATRTAELETANRDLQVAKNAAEQANLAKSDFLTRMSHELRTPLNAILGFAQVLEMTALEPRQQAHVKHIHTAGRHLLGLINEVLDIAKVEAGQLNISLEPVMLSTLISEALDLVQPLAAQRGIHFVRVQTDEKTVLADRQRLRQVLLNLFANAIKYNQEGGTVTLTWEARPGNCLRLNVRDTGPGIPAHMLDRVFVPFDRLDAEKTGVEGTGLGLALSKRLIEAMHGAIGVESQVGTGSVFWLELPEVKEPAEQMLRAEPPSPITVSPQRLSKSVLYVENDPASLDLVEQILVIRPGVKLLSAIQGRMCLDLARQHQPDLILLDLNLPDIHGEEVLRQLQIDSRTRDIPVVIISAHAIPDHENRLQKVGVRAYLTKPFNLGQFLQTIDELLI